MGDLTFIFKVIWAKNMKIRLNWGDLGPTCMINYGVTFSPTAFKLGANRVHIEIFNISSGFFEIKKKIRMTVFTI